MGFIKRIYTPDNTGCSAEYWKISEINSDWIDNMITVKLLGFISQQAADEGRSHLLQREFVATGDVALQYFSTLVMQPEGIDILHLAYGFIKGAPNSEFVDAVDV